MMPAMTFTQREFAYLKRLVSDDLAALRTYQEFEVSVEDAATLINKLDWVANSGHTHFYPAEPHD